jgi:hypothetical protein
MPLVEVSPPGVSLPSIVAVAGRRIDASDAQTARFPYGNADASERPSRARSRIPRQY